MDGVEHNISKLAKRRMTKIIEDKPKKKKDKSILENFCISGIKQNVFLKIAMKLQSKLFLLQKSIVGAQKILVSVFYQITSSQKKYKSQ